MDRIVLGYSGDLDSSVAIAWLAEQHDAEIVTVTLDLGQAMDLSGVRDRALAIGAVRAHIVDAREAFANGVLVRALQAGADDARMTALAQPLIAKHLVEIAHIEGTSLVAHNVAHNAAHDAAGAPGPSTGLDELLRTLDPALEVLVPSREWGMSAPEVLEFARARGIPLPTQADRAWSATRNLWGRSITGGRLDDVWLEPTEEAYTLTRSPAEAPDTPASIEIEFDRGVPLTLNGVAMSTVELLTSLETIAGAHGVGRLDTVVHTAAGTRREVAEAPAAVVLQKAHRDLQRFVVPPELDRMAEDLGERYAELINEGRWYSTAREAIDAFVAKVQESVSGVVRLKCFKGECRVAGRQAAPIVGRAGPGVPAGAGTGRSS